MRLIAGDVAWQLLLCSLVPIRRAVGAGLGPHGTPCLFGTGQATIRLTTGCEVSRHIGGRGTPGDVAPRLMTEVLVAAERDLGDGTARLAIILDAMLREGGRCIAAGAAVNPLAAALPLMARRLGEELAAAANPLPDLVAVARTAGGDADVAAALAALAAEIGDGATIDVAAGGEPGLEAQSDRAFLMDADPVSSRLPVADLDNVHILVANEIIDDFGSLAPVLETFAARGKALLVVARDITGAALQTLSVNKATTCPLVAALKPAAVATEAADNLQDLALVTGATLICSREGTGLSSLRPAMLGSAQSFRLQRAVARLTVPGGDPAGVAARCRALAAEAEAKKFLALDRERLLRRAARLSGKWGELRVGPDRAGAGDSLLPGIRRAATATVAATRSGSIAGGAEGLAKILAELTPTTDGERSAWRCLAAGIAATHYHLVRNAGGDAPSLADPLRIVDRLARGDVDLRVQDPQSVLAEIFNRAASAAAALLMTDTILCSGRQILVQPTV